MFSSDPWIWEASRNLINNHVNTQINAGSSAATAAKTLAYCEPRRDDVERHQRVAEGQTKALQEKHASQQREIDPRIRNPCGTDARAGGHHRSLRGRFRSAKIAVVQSLDVRSRIGRGLFRISGAAQAIGLRSPSSGLPIDLGSWRNDGR